MKWSVTMSIAGVPEGDDVFDTYEEAKAEQERLIRETGHGEDYWIIVERED